MCFDLCVIVQVRDVDLDLLGSVTCSHRSQERSASLQSSLRLAHRILPASASDHQNACCRYIRTGAIAAPQHPRLPAVQLDARFAGSRPQARRWVRSQVHRGRQPGPIEGSAGQSSQPGGMFSSVSRIHSLRIVS